MILPMPRRAEAMSIEVIRELNDAELDGVSGGVDVISAVVHAFIDAILEMRRAERAANPHADCGLPGGVC
jgi:hypothetical protein